MWPLFLLLGVVAVALVSKKAGAPTSAIDGPNLLASMTAQYGAPTGTQNAPASSGRNYRVSHWSNRFVLALGGAWANQPSMPNAAYAYSQNSTDPYHFTELASNLPDTIAIGDMAQIRVAGGLSSVAAKT
jgi:hypothetical protein